MRLSLSIYVKSDNPHITALVIMSFSGRAIEAYIVFFVFLYYTNIPG